MAAWLAAQAVRPAQLQDADAIAACHVSCWRESYAHLLSPAFLAGLDVGQRSQMWRQRLSGDNAGCCVVAVAGELIVGFARSIPTRDDPPVRDLELAALYLRAGLHGSGLGQALLDATVDDQLCSLWVAEDNPRGRGWRVDVAQLGDRCLGLGARRSRRGSREILSTSRRPTAGPRRRDRVAGVAGQHDLAGARRASDR